MRLYTDKASTQTLEMIELRHDGLGIFRNAEGPYETRITCHPSSFFIEQKRLLEPRREIGPQRRPLLEQFCAPVVDLRAQLQAFVRRPAA